ncbi:MAG: MFS transporter [Gammaproteobacteria bacterium]
MNSLERRATTSLSMVFGLRLFGLFIVLPILSLYTMHLPGATPTLMGLALGIYGLTQAIFQIPFGMWSDRVGRKKVIAIGFVIFALGSLLVALFHSIYAVLLGRALQGAGAVGSTVIALLADLTDETQRTKAMAILGTTIAVAFMLSLIVGPTLNHFISIPGIFLLITLLALIALVLLFTWVPTPQTSVFHADAEVNKNYFKEVLFDTQLLRLNLGIFVSHALLIASFVVIPIILNQQIRMANKQVWMVYLPALVLAFVTMVFMIIKAEKKQQMKQFLLLSIGLLAVSESILSLDYTNQLVMTFALYLFFTAFTFLEAALPSLVSKLAPKTAKGTAMGVYSSAQFLGIFCGGYLGGFLYQFLSLRSVFIFSALLALIWFFIAYPMKNPRNFQKPVINIDL